jgi:hypothetical protein
MTDQSSVLFRGSIEQGVEVLLSQDGSRQSSYVDVENSDALSIGQDVSLGWVITEEFVAEHGMSAYWTTFNGQWVPFFRRK